MAATSKELAKIAQIDAPDVIADNMLAKRDEHLIKASPSDICEYDGKELKSANEIPFYIAQVFTSQSEVYLKRKEKLEKALDKIDSKKHTEGSVLMITDILQGATYLISSSKMKEHAKNALDSNNISLLYDSIGKNTPLNKEVLSEMHEDKTIPKLNNVDSRKEEIQPFISQLLDAANDA